MKKRKEIPFTISDFSKPVDYENKSKINSTKKKNAHMNI